MRTAAEGCGGIDPCTPGICERLSTPSDESYACIMLRRSITLKTAVEADKDITERSDGLGFDLENLMLFGHVDR